MSNEKRPAPARTEDPVTNPDSKSAPPEEDDADLDLEDEHDGWGPIVKRRTPVDPTPRR
jgi:hypothetical protein